MKFREHSGEHLSAKKGNVDTEIVFEVMKRLYLDTSFDKFLLVSGDGDYFRLVKFLIERGRFEKVLFPDHKNASSLYKRLGSEYFVFLDDSDTKRKIEKKKRPA